MKKILLAGGTEQSVHAFSLLIFSFRNILVGDHALGTYMVLWLESGTSYPAGPLVGEAVSLPALIPYVARAARSRTFRIRSSGFSKRFRICSAGWSQDPGVELWLCLDEFFESS